MARKNLKLSDVSTYRKGLGLNQREFWAPMGVTQSGGSRYEAQRAIPKPVALLLLLRDHGMISQEHLDWGHKELAKQRAAGEARARLDVKRPRRSRR